MAVQQEDIYERARLSRDPRFDGRFFVGVRTTGIYCRPICPANSPRRENVRFFPSAAAAGEAGYRPCLRCRPETAPGSPAWTGTSATVRRGLRLIAGGVLEDSDVERLAERLGVTSRHLRRLFTRHVGASPLAVAHTQRLHFAKRLIDDTTLSMQDIAIAAGYGSVRRFNDAFRKAYGRPPSELRRVGDSRAEAGVRPGLTVRLAYRRPFDWAAMLRFFNRRATPGVEAVAGDAYRRTVRLGEQAGVLELRPDARDGYLLLSLRGLTTQVLFEAVQRARELFDLDAPVDEIAGVLGRDALLAGPLRQTPGIRVVGAWDGFELAVRAILGQQVSVAAATTLAGRIAARYGEPLAGAAEGDPALLFPGPERLARARFNEVGLVRQRAATIRSLAAAVLKGEIDFDFAQDPAAFCERLTSIDGIGEWTAEYIAMRVLKNPDALPASDLGLRKALGTDRPATANELKSRAEEWRPWRAYGAMLLWNSLSGSGG
ncbi:MAG: helix-turn-helix domain-containing protein [Gammaproteobacteria bacterium]|nr:helix-turn-helix domain-containing protein [Gammaproteobacteria bacterium]MDH4255048.1 helix-turn-helix domain-containing protein [Gammaproteobacteria bacterium]MDH5310952.1 helix-turn-helix domain-containing protein [Gammaproteobacteria bacterium]